jgi:hypothetical protein
MVEIQRVFARHRVDARAAARERRVNRGLRKSPAIAASIDRSACQINLLFMLLFKPILDHRL